MMQASQNFIIFENWKVIFSTASYPTCRYFTRIFTQRQRRWEKKVPVKWKSGENPHPILVFIFFPVARGCLQKTKNDVWRQNFTIVPTTGSIVPWYCSREPTTNNNLYNNSNGIQIPGVIHTLFSLYLVLQFFLFLFRLSTRGCNDPLGLEEIWWHSRSRLRDWAFTRG